MPDKLNQSVQEPQVSDIFPEELYFRQHRLSLVENKLNLIGKTRVGRFRFLWWKRLSLVERVNRDTINGQLRSNWLGCHLPWMQRYEQAPWWQRRQLDFWGLKYRALRRLVVYDWFVRQVKEIRAEFYSDEGRNWSQKLSAINFLLPIILKPEKRLQTANGLFRIDLSACFLKFQEEQQNVTPEVGSSNQPKNQNLFASKWGPLFLDTLQNNAVSSAQFTRLEGKPTELSVLELDFTVEYCLAIHEDTLSDKHVFLNAETQAARHQALIARLQAIRFSFLSLIASSETSQPTSWDEKLRFVSPYQLVLQKRYKILQRKLCALYCETSQASASRDESFNVVSVLNTCCPELQAENAQAFWFKLKNSYAVDAPLELLRHWCAKGTRVEPEQAARMLNFLNDLTPPDTNSTVLEQLATLLKWSGELKRVKELMFDSLTSLATSFPVYYEQLTKNSAEKLQIVDEAIQEAQLSMKKDERIWSDFQTAFNILHTEFKMEFQENVEIQKPGLWWHEEEVTDYVALQDVVRPTYFRFSRDAALNKLLAPILRAQQAATHPSSLLPKETQFDSDCDRLIHFFYAADAALKKHFGVPSHKAKIQFNVYTGLKLFKPSRNTYPEYTVNEERFKLAQSKMLSELSRLWRSISKVHHPDKQKSNEKATEQFQLLSALKDKVTTRLENINLCSLFSEVRLLKKRKVENLSDAWRARIQCEDKMKAEHEKEEREREEKLSKIKKLRAINAEKKKRVLEKEKRVAETKKRVARLRKEKIDIIIPRELKLISLEYEQIYKEEVLMKHLSFLNKFNELSLVKQCIVERKERITKAKTRLAKFSQNVAPNKEILDCMEEYKVCFEAHNKCGQSINEIMMQFSEVSGSIEFEQEKEKKLIADDSLVGYKSLLISEPVVKPLASNNVDNEESTRHRRFSLSDLKL